MNAPRRADLTTCAGRAAERPDATRHCVAGPLERAGTVVRRSFTRRRSIGLYRTIVVFGLVVTLGLVDAGLQKGLRSTGLHVPGLAVLAAQASSAQRHGQLFPPTDLGLLETPDRAAWQKPEQIMDALKIAENAKVADIGAGGGFFTIRLARRVGPNGFVYAEDVQQPMLEAIKRRVTREELKNVETVLGTANNPNLPAGALDAILFVDGYQEVEDTDRVPFLRNIARGLKPGGRLGIVNYKPGRGGPGPDVRVPIGVVEADAAAAGLRVIDRADLPFQYLLVLGR
jgi:SAM-dependent methyltransferase